MKLCRDCKHVYLTNICARKGKTVDLVNGTKVFVSPFGCGRERYGPYTLEALWNGKCGKGGKFWEASGTDYTEADESGTVAVKGIQPPDWSHYTPE